MTGLCCRCQVRHDTELCCRHGVICSGDVAGPCEQLDERGAGDALVLAVALLVFAAVLVGCTWLGYHGSDTAKLLAGLALFVLGGGIVAAALREQVDVPDVDPWPRLREPYEHVRIIETRRSTSHEPKEQ